jgi:hypothetical protein
MTPSENPPFRVFETRESDEYIQILTEALSVEGSPSATYPDLVSSSYKLTEEATDRINQGHNSNITRVINIDYVGMAATVLLDRNKQHTRNAHYEQLSELLSSLKSLNGDGIALKIRILLQYPYSLAGQNRILSEIWTDRSFMGETTESRRDETRFAPPLTTGLIDNSVLRRTQQESLLNLQHLLDENNLHLFDGSKPAGPNKIEVRFAFISTLICGLRVNNLFFYDPYHYGRKKGDSACAFRSTPVVMIDGGNHCSAYEAFCNHFRCMWECDSTLDYDDVVEREPRTITVMIRKPESLKTSHKTRRLKSLPIKSPDLQKIEWDLREGKLYRLVNMLCPIVPSVDAEEIGFLAAAWEKKDGGTEGPCEPASMLENLFKAGFESLPNPGRVHVKVLQSQVGSSLTKSLFDLMDVSTFSIIMLTKEIEDKFCKPNVYLELGYLLNKNKKSHTFIVAEHGVIPPTDVQDITFIPFDRTKPHQSLNEMKRVCEQLLKAMRQARIISGETYDLLIKWLREN